MKIEVSHSQLLSLVEEMILENGRYRIALEAIYSVASDGHLPAPGDFGVKAATNVADWCAQRARMGLGRHD